MTTCGKISHIRPSVQATESRTTTDWSPIKCNSVGNACNKEFNRVSCDDWWHIITPKPTHALEMKKLYIFGKLSILTNVSDMGVGV